MARTPKPLIDPDAPAPTAEPVVNNPPYEPPMGHADAPPPVPKEANPDPQTQDYLDGFAKSPDPRDPVESELTPGDLNPPTTNEGGGEGGGTPDPIVPVNVDVPVVSQDVAGAVLNCTMGNWDGVPETYAYQWNGGGADVGDGTAVHPVTEADVGVDFYCVVTAMNAAGSAVAPPSNTVTVVSGAARDAGHGGRRHKEDKGEDPF